MSYLLISARDLLASVSVNPARNSIYADSMGSQLNGQSPGEAYYSTLRGYVVGKSLGTGEEDL